MNQDSMKQTRKASSARMFLLMIGVLLIFNAVTTNIRYGTSWLGMAALVEDTLKEDALKGDAQKADDRKEDVRKEDSSVPETETQTAENVPGGAEKLTEAAPGEAEEETGIASENTEFDVHELIQQMEASNVTVSNIRISGIAFLIAAVFEILTGLICVLFSNRVDRSRITLTATIVLVAVEICFIALLIVNRMFGITMLIYSMLLPIVLVWNARKLRQIAVEEPERVYAVQPAGRMVSGDRKAKEVQAPKKSKSLRERAMAATGGDDHEPMEDEESADRTEDTYVIDIDEDAEDAESAEDIDLTEDDHPEDAEGAENTEDLENGKDTGNTENTESSENKEDKENL